jgi:hypothetical protein
MSQKEFWKQLIYHCQTWKTIEIGLKHIEKATASTVTR